MSTKEEMLRVQCPPSASVPNFAHPEPTDLNVTDSFQALLSSLLDDNDNQVPSASNTSAQLSPTGASVYDGYLSSPPSEDLYSCSSQPTTPPEEKYSTAATPGNIAAGNRGGGVIRSKSTEQRRRSQINDSFSTLHNLIPSLSRSDNSSTSKAGKATVLAKTADYIEKLKVERENMQEEAEKLQAEIEALNESISGFQALLPETGISTLTVNSDEQDKQRFTDYVTRRSTENYKFHIFSKMMEGLFETYCSEVTSRNLNDLQTSAEKWLEEKCDLPSLRPSVLTSLRTLATETSILTEPEKLESEIRQKVASTIEMQQAQIQQAQIQQAQMHMQQASVNTVQPTGYQTLTSQPHVTSNQLPFI